MHVNWKRLFLISLFEKEDGKNLVNKFAKGVSWMEEDRGRPGPDTATGRPTFRCTASASMWSKGETSF